MLNLDDYIYKLFLDIRNSVLLKVDADIKYMEPNQNRHFLKSSHLLSIFLNKSSAYLYYNQPDGTFTYHGQSPYGVKREVICNFKLSDPDLRNNIAERIIDDLRN